MFKNEGGGVNGRLNNVKKKTDDLAREGVRNSRIKQNKIGNFLSLGRLLPCLHFKFALKTA